jgi:hypothetical protein
MPLDVGRPATAHDEPLLCLISTVWYSAKHTQVFLDFEVTRETASTSAGQQQAGERHEVPGRAV